MFAVAIALSLAGLSLGAALFALGRGRQHLQATLDGLVLGLVPLLILLRFLPHLYAETGAWAVALVALGFGALWLAERRRIEGAARVGRALMVPTLALHSLLDGAALSVAFAERSSGSAEALLGVALVVHRLPEGLLLWSVLVPALGPRRTLARVVLVGLATVAGALGGRAVLGHLPETAVHVLVAIGFGGILRLALHRHDAGRASPRARGLGAAGFLLGALLVLIVPSPGDVLRSAQPRELSLLESIGPLFVETAPSMLLGLLGAGLLHAFAPRRMEGFLRSARPLSQAVRGVLFGIPLPVCSCGVLPLLRRLLLAGVPIAAAVSFAIATPELDLGGIALSVRLLGVPFTILRVAASLVAAIVVALAVAAICGRSAGSASSAPIVAPAPTGSLAARARLAVAEAFGPSLDHLAAFYVIGLVVAAAVEAALEPALIAKLGAPLDVFVGAFAAIPAYVCAQGTTPLAAVLVHKGLSVGAALAILMVGPATNLGVIGVIRRRLGARAAALFAAGNIAIAVVAGLAANAFVPRSTVPEVHALVAHDHLGFEWICAIALAALLLRSLFRLGPRAWFGALLADHDHDHAGACCEGHEGCDGSSHPATGRPIVARVTRRVTEHTPRIALVRAGRSGVRRQAP